MALQLQPGALNHVVCICISPTERCWLFILHGFVDTKIFQSNYLCFHYRFQIFGLFPKIRSKTQDTRELHLSIYIVQYMESMDVSYCDCSALLYNQTMWLNSKAMKHTNGKLGVKFLIIFVLFSLYFSSSFSYCMAGCFLFGACTFS